MSSFASDRTEEVAHEVRAGSHRLWGLSRAHVAWLLIGLTALAVPHVVGCTMWPRTSAVDRQAVSPSASVGTTRVARVQRTASNASDALRARSSQPSDRGFDLDAVLRDVSALTRRGVRTGGSSGEKTAADYIVRRLASLGLHARTERFKLSNGRTSRNVIVVIPGSNARRIVVGAHMDSKPPAPGANDDAVGCAALLELVRVLRARPAVPTVEFDFFGAEEYIDKAPGHHHYGSRFRVSRLTSEERAAIAGMMALDVLAVGTTLHVRTMGVGPMTMAAHVIRSGRRVGVPVTYLRDPGPSGWADHEAFEKAGIPVAWIERLDDPHYHTAGDTAAHLQRARLVESLAVAEEAIRSLTPARLSALRR